MFPAFAASLFLGLEFLVECGLQETVSISAVGVCEITPDCTCGLEKNGN